MSPVSRLRNALHPLQLPWHLVRAIVQTFRHHYVKSPDDAEREYVINQRLGRHVVFHVGLLALDVGKRGANLNGVVILYRHLLQVGVDGVRQGENGGQEPDQDGADHSHRFSLQAEICKQKMLK